MKNILITGSSGFLGSKLIAQLRHVQSSAIGIDKIPSSTTDTIIDLRNREAVFEIFQRTLPNQVIHLAADIDFNGESGTALFQNNVQGTKNISDAAEKFKVDHLIFTSSCSIFAGAEGKIFNEQSKPHAIDDYGRAKIEEEQYILGKATQLKISIIRTPMIIGPGRLGMLSILFNLIERGNVVWVLGQGDVRHQLIYSQDICRALLEVNTLPSGIYNVGSDDVPTFHDMFEKLISNAKSPSRILSIPKGPAVLALDFTRRLKLSPIGNYQLRMLTEDFYFDCTKLKTLSTWRPSRSNTEMLVEAYDSYKMFSQSKNETKSTNQSKASMGILSILKYLY